MKIQEEWEYPMSKIFFIKCNCLYNYFKFFSVFLVALALVISFLQVWRRSSQISLYLASYYSKREMNILKVRQDVTWKS